MIHTIVHLVSFFRFAEIGGEGGGEIVLNLIDLLEELYQSDFFCHSIHNHCLIIKESV